MNQPGITKDQKAACSVQLISCYLGTYCICLTEILLLQFLNILHLITYLRCKKPQTCSFVIISLHVMMYYRNRISKWHAFTLMKSACRVHRPKAFLRFLVCFGLTHQPRHYSDHTHYSGMTPHTLKSLF